jgi:hypothetical protein
VVIFAIKNCVSIPSNTFIALHPLEFYYINQADRGITHSGDRPVYSAPLHQQRRQDIGNYFVRLIRWVGPLLWRGDKAVGRETLRTGGKILTEIVQNKSPEVSQK